VYWYVYLTLPAVARWHPAVFQLPANPTNFFAVAVIHATFVSSDGNSNWLLGVQLVCSPC
jgi:Ca2+/H+ antiporter